MMQLNNRRLTLAIAVLVTVAIVLTATTYAALGTNQNPSAEGVVEVSADLGVYLDCDCTTDLSTINWGILSPGQSTTNTIFIKNTGNSALSLRMETSNWDPVEANGPITITWNRENASIEPEETTIAIITLTVASSEVDFSTFGVQISIAGTT